MSDYAFSIVFAYHENDGKVWYSIAGIIYAIYLVIVLLNVKYGWIFYYDPVEGYLHGPLSKITYVLTFIYIVLSVSTVATHKKTMATRLYVTFLTYPIVSMGILSIQFFNPTVLLTGTATFAALLFAYISIQSDMLEFDLSTGLMAEKKLKEHVESKHNKSYLFVLAIENMTIIQNYMDTADFTRMLMSISNEFSSRFSRRCYHPVTNRFAAFYDDLDETKRLAEEIVNYLRKPETMELLNIPMQLEAYPIIIGLKEGEKKYGNIIEIANNMFQKKASVSDFSVSVCDESVLVNMERKKMIFKILQRELNIESEMFQIWYQPIYSLKDNRFAYMEALSRLKGTEIGDIPPQEFVEVAEKRGLIEKLGFVAFEKVCKFLSENRGVIDAVSINFSVHQMTNPTIVNLVLDTIKRFNLEPSKIIMEITESIFIENYQLVLRNMDELSKAGIHFYLDDFGTGYSNLSNVIGLPFSTIKMDRSLVLMMEENEKNQQLFMNLVSTFKDASLKVLVEGVETQNQNYLVSKAGADYIQGFLYSRPLPPSDCIDLFKRQK